MSGLFDADLWLSTIRAGAAAALANAVPIPPAGRKPITAPAVALKERAWDPGDQEGLLADLTRYSCVLVRDFIPKSEAGRLAGIGWRCFEEVDANLERTAQGLPPKLSDYNRPRDAEPLARLGNDRSLRSFGGMMIEAVPYAGYELFGLLRASGLLPIVEAYIGGRPLVSGLKCTLRLGDKDAPVRHVFHQDGAFLGGPSARTLNIWLALTDAGVDAPGLEVLPYRVPVILPPGEEGSYVPWEVKEARVYDQFGRDSFVIPNFRAGDALLFDQMCLHRTHVRPEMTRKRLAYECWFFPPDPEYARLGLLSI